MINYKSEKWAKEVQKWIEPVNEQQSIKGRWSNVTRKQTVEIKEVKMSDWYKVLVVEYYHKDCKHGIFYYFKPVTQFLRSYEKAK